MERTPCCPWCGSVDRWTYELCGDGDGIEFLIETAHLVGGGETTTTVVYAAPGLNEVF
jgi:hypothetical protein